MLQAVDTRYGAIVKCPGMVGSHKVCRQQWVAGTGHCLGRMSKHAQGTMGRHTARHTTVHRQVEPQGEQVGW